jgi:hypothetical protein
VTKNSLAILLVALVACYGPAASAPVDTAAEVTTADATTDATEPDDSTTETGTDTSGRPGDETHADDSTTSVDAQPCVLGSAIVGACRL